MNTLDKPNPVKDLLSHRQAHLDTLATRPNLEPWQVTLIRRARYSTWADLWPLLTPDERHLDRLARSRRSN